MKLRALAIITAALALTGCASTPDGERAERIAVQGATVLLIERSERPGDKAARVVEAIDRLQTILLDTNVTVGDLRSTLLQRVAERELSPGEKMLALEVIAEVATVVETKVGKGYLSAEAIVTVNTVLGWIENTAALYVPIRS